MAGSRTGHIPSISAPPRQRNANHFPDVYKRQVQGKTKIVDHQQVQAGDDNLIVARHTHEPIISHAVFEAVSYTHLDVYKRQAVGRQNQSENLTDAVLSFAEGIGVIKSYNLLGEKSDELMVSSCFSAKSGSSTALLIL